MEEQTTQASGGRKADGGKPRFDLIPPGPLREVAALFALGAAKYEDRNWERGLDWGRVFGALQRHAWAWWGGEEFDPVDGQHHLASVAWCALALMEYRRTHPELDDRPHVAAFGHPLDVECACCDQSVLTPGCPCSSRPSGPVLACRTDGCAAQRATCCVPGHEGRELCNGPCSASGRCLSHHANADAAPAA